MFNKENFLGCSVLLLSGSKFVTWGYQQNQSPLLLEWTENFQILNYNCIIIQYIILSITHKYLPYGRWVIWIG